MYVSQSRSGWADDRVGVNQGRAFGSFEDQDNKSHNHGITDPGHGHSLNDPGHFHTFSRRNDRGGQDPSGGNDFLRDGSNSSTINTNTKTTGISVNLGHTGISTQNQGSESRPRNIAMMYVIKT